MGFVYEIVPEEDWEFFRSMKLKDCWGAMYKILSKDTKWCADRERNAYLVGIGGGYAGMPHFYDLWWNGNVIRMETTSREIRNDEEGFDIKWIIHKIPIPEKIWSCKDEIKDMIEEAFSVNESWCKGRKIDSIKVVFRCEPEIEESK